MIVLCWKNHLVLQGRVREVGCALVFPPRTRGMNGRKPSCLAFRLLRTVSEQRSIQKGLPSTLGSPIANALELTIANYANGT